MLISIFFGGILYFGAKISIGVSNNIIVISNDGITIATKTYETDEEAETILENIKTAIEAGSYLLDLDSLLEVSEGE